MSKIIRKTLTACIQEIPGDKYSASFVVSSYERVPEIAQRGKRKK